MKAILFRFWGKLHARLLPLVDMTAWLLLLVSSVPLLVIQPAMVVTLVTWTAYSLALAGSSVTLCRLVLPQVKLTRWLELAATGNTAAGLVVLAVLGVWCAIFLGLVLWAKA